MSLIVGAIREFVFTRSPPNHSPLEGESPPPAAVGGSVAYHGATTSDLLSMVRQAMDLTDRICIQH